MDNTYESDMLIFKENGSIFEIEIKVSRADFFADFKKGQKHLCLEEGGFTANKDTWKTNKETRKVNKFKKGEFISVELPNRFYFAVPEGMIKVNELPEYCGLFYIGKSGSVKKIKESKILTKERKIDFEKLANKFYWAWMTSKKKI